MKVEERFGRARGKFGDALIEGYYVRHEKITLSPIYYSKEQREKEEKENTEHWIVIDSISDWNMNREVQRAIIEDPETIQFSTGIILKDGTEVFEGDILLFPDGREVSVVRDKHCDFRLFSIKDPQDPLEFMFHEGEPVTNILKDKDFNEIKVIGTGFEMKSEES